MMSNNYSANQCLAKFGEWSELDEEDEDFIIEEDSIEIEDETGDFETPEDEDSEDFETEEDTDS